MNYSDVLTNFFSMWRPCFTRMYWQTVVSMWHPWFTRMYWLALFFMWHPWLSRMYCLAVFSIWYPWFPRMYWQTVVSMWHPWFTRMYWLALFFMWHQWLSQIYWLALLSIWHPWLSRMYWLTCADLCFMLVYITPGMWIGVLGLHRTQCSYNKTIDVSPRDILSTIYYTSWGAEKLGPRSHRRWKTIQLLSGYAW